jgi:hypothetical protein
LESELARAERAAAKAAERNEALKGSQAKLKKEMTSLQS